MKIVYGFIIGALLLIVGETSALLGCFYNGDPNEGLRMFFIGVMVAAAGGLILTYSCYSLILLKIMQNKIAHEFEANISNTDDEDRIDEVFNQQSETPITYDVEVPEENHLALSPKPNDQPWWDRLGSSSLR